MCFTVELQVQLSVFNIAPGAVEGGGAFAAARFHQNEIRIGSTADAVGARNHVHGIIGL